MNKEEEKIIRNQDQENAFLPADHKLLEKMQQAFKKQLEEEKKKLQIEYLKKAQQLEDIQKSKEEVGV